MRYLQKNILVIIAILLTGCTTLELVMKVDTSLKANATAYEITSPDSWSTDKKLNVSFGPYRVTNLKSGWTRTQTKKPSETGGFLTDILFETTGIRTGDSTDDDDYNEISSDPNTTRTEVSESLTYHFTINDKVTWHGECHHTSERDLFEKKNLRNINILSSKYFCHYTHTGGTPWVLSIDRHSHSGELNIKMTGKEGVFTAHSSRGYYVTSDGQPYKTLRPSDPGYTWTDANGKSIAAISVKGETPKVWLGNNNPDSTNDALSMANTGLLIYEKKIKPTLR